MNWLVIPKKMHDRPNGPRTKLKNREYQAKPGKSYRYWLNQSSRDAIFIVEQYNHLKNI
jgi:hypothetical protein